MTIHIPRPTLLLLLFALALSAAERGSAQTSDPALRLPGDAVDSITGGPPTVMIRALTKKDYAYPRTHAITYDPILAFLYLNIEYEQGLNNWFTLGGRLQVPRGIVSSDETENIWVVGADARFYFDQEGMKGFFTRLSPTVYLGSPTLRLWDEGASEYVTREVDILIPSVHAEAGWRVIWFNRISVDWSLGIEMMFGDPATLSELTFIWYGDDVITGSSSVRLGWTW